MLLCKVSYVRETADGCRVVPDSRLFAVRDDIPTIDELVDLSIERGCRVADIVALSGCSLADIGQSRPFVSRY